MAIKVLIADDETPIREWIQFCLMHTDGLVEIVGVAANGKEALSIFLDKHPEIVITDIKMPIMNGLELMKSIKSMNENVSFIILTCHEDFEYARMAISLGAEDYLLKTEVTNESLIKIISRLAGKIRNSINNETKHIDRQLYLQAILIGQTEADEVTLRRKGILADKKSYFVAAVWRDSKYFTYMPVKELAENNFNIAYIPYDKDIFLLVISMDASKSMLMQINNIAQFAETAHKHFGGTIGISRVYNLASYFREAVESAISQLSEGFYKGKGSVNIELPNFKKPVDFNLEEVTNEILKHLYSYSREELRQEVEALLNRISSIHYPNPDHIFQSFEKICDRLCEKNEALISIKPNISQAMDFSELKTMVLKFIEAKPDDSGRINRYVNDAINYIRNHYSDECSLNDVANAIGLNPEYLSRLFKSNIGYNFQIFITQIRIDKAKELIQETDMTIGDIAFRVGYQNIAYFSRLFKKNVGTSPFEYRK